MSIMQEKNALLFFFVKLHNSSFQQADKIWDEGGSCPSSRVPQCGERYHLLIQVVNRVRIMK